MLISPTFWKGRDQISMYLKEKLKDCMKNDKFYSNP